MMIIVFQLIQINGLCYDLMHVADFWLNENRGYTSFSKIHKCSIFERIFHRNKLSEIKIFGEIFFSLYYPSKLSWVADRRKYITWKVTRMKKKNSKNEKLCECIVFWMLQISLYYL